MCSIMWFNICALHSLEQIAVLALLSPVTVWCMQPPKSPGNYIEELFAVVPTPNDSLLPLSVW